MTRDNRGRFAQAIAATEAADHRETEPDRQYNELLAIDWIRSSSG